MEKRWSVKKHDFDRVSSLANELGVVPLVAALLIDRGAEDPESARKFLHPSHSDLHDPYLLRGMDRSVSRIKEAIERRERILIWGDYDVDGTTGTALLRKAFRELGVETDFHIPDRFTEGYGLNIPALNEAARRGCRLVITVDCGTRSFEPIAWARANGLDVIITDHHLSDDEQSLPEAIAVINPKSVGCGYPDKELAGVGVALKLAQALLGERSDSERMNSFLEIAAIGTVADMMDLNGENRAIVTLGLRQLNRTRNIGLRALMEVADCTAEMSSVHIGFRIAPRINAAGRMDIGSSVVELLETKNIAEARRIAASLDSRNRERQRMQAYITERAFEEVLNYPNQEFMVVGGEGWHRGVIGLAASRLVEKFNRPAIVLSIENGVAHGSARGIRNFHVLDALASCSDIFDQFGGHAAAAGLKLKSSRIGELRERLNSFAATKLRGLDLLPVLDIDAVVTSETLSLEMLKQIACLEPFGIGNPKPVFLTSGLKVTREPLIMKERHLKFSLADRHGKYFEAVWWNGVERTSGRTFGHNSGIEVAYTADANEWQGKRRLQLVIEDIRSAGETR